MDAVTLPAWSGYAHSGGYLRGIVVSMGRQNPLVNSELWCQLYQEKTFFGLTHMNVSHVLVGFLWSGRGVVE